MLEQMMLFAPGFVLGLVLSAVLAALGVLLRLRDEALSAFSHARGRRARRDDRRHHRLAGTDRRLGARDVGGQRQPVGPEASNRGGKLTSPPGHASGLERQPPSSRQPRTGALAFSVCGRGPAPARAVAGRSRVRHLSRIGDHAARCRIEVPACAPAVALAAVLQAATLGAAAHVLAFGLALALDQVYSAVMIMMLAGLAAATSLRRNEHPH